MLREVGCEHQNVDVRKAFRCDVAIIGASRLQELGSVGRLKLALEEGKTVCLHGLDPTKTRTVLDALQIQGVTVSAAPESQVDTFLHNDPLTDGMANGYLYWIVNKAKVAPWTQAPLHPRQASALIQCDNATSDGKVLTRRGALAVFQVGSGRLIFDFLCWQHRDLDEPERARRYLVTLLTNLGFKLAKGHFARSGENFETDAERRERGHF